MQAPQSPVVRLTLPPGVEHVALCRSVAEGAGRVAGLDADAIADLRTAVSEAVANAVVHGCARVRRAVEVVVEALPGAVVVEVADPGDGFDPAAQAAPRAEELPEDGLGLVLLRALADELEVRRGDGGDGCVVRLVKRAAHAPCG